MKKAQIVVISGIVIAISLVFSFASYNEVPIFSVLDEGFENPPPSNQTNSTIPDPPPPTIDLDELALEIHNAVNEQRELNNLGSLAWNSGIASVALSHSLDMNENNYVGHISLDGKGSVERGVEAGFEWCGDPSSITLYNNLDAEEKLFLDRVDSYNQDVQQYEKDLYFFENFQSDNIGLYNKLQQDHIQLQTTRIEIETMNKDVDSKFNEVNDRINQKLFGKGLSENIAMLQGYDSNSIINETISGWLGSDGHRENMLNNVYHQSGIGIAFNEDTDTFYITQNFC